MRTRGRASVGATCPARAMTGGKALSAICTPLIVLFDRQRLCTRIARSLEAGLRLP